MQAIRSRAAALALVAVTLSYAPQASALQPLSTFLKAARRHAYQNQEAIANVSQAEANVAVARAAVLPSLSARGTYTRNQYQVTVDIPVGDGPPRELVIQPYNQLDAFFTLEVPIIRIGDVYRLRGASESAEAARASRELTALQIDEIVGRTYYQLLGQEALRNAAKRNLEVAQRNAQNVQARAQAGASPELDVQRANAAVEQAKYELQSAELNIRLASRQLETLTGIRAEPTTSFEIASVEDTGSLSEWMKAVAEHPQLRVARAQNRAATENARAARWALAPTLNGTAQERLTNATGFVGREAFYTLGLTLSWTIDTAIVARIRAQDAVVAAASVREAQTRRDLQDSLFDAYQRVQTGVTRSQASKSQADASRRAAELAEVRFGAGAATQLEVVEAQRDAFRADVALIQANADLAFARTLLRIRAAKTFK